MKRKNVILPVILVLLILIFCLCGGLLYRYYSESRTQQAQFDTLTDLKNQIPSESPTETGAPIPQETATEAETEPEPPAQTETTEATEPPILPEYEALFALNRDMVGWVCIEGTAIDYPVMQSPYDPDFYLKHDFYGADSTHGCIYARSTCDVNAPSDNVTLFGHHMKDGSMFAGLKYYVQKAYWESHSLIRFDTLTESHTYQIFAVFKTSGTTGEGFAYHTFVNAEDEEAFNAFVSTVIGMSFYDTGIVPVYGDKLLCLSTCEYTLNNGRLVVAAVRIE